MQPALHLEKNRAGALKVVEATFPADATVGRFRQAFVRIEPELRELSGNLWHVNVDIEAAVTTVLGVLPKIDWLRSEGPAHLADFDVARFDKLEDYALALGYAHAAYRATAEPVDTVPALAAEAAEVRGVLLSDAAALAKRGLLDPARVAKLHSPGGYGNIVFDVLGLVSLFRESWNHIENKTALRPGELDRAELSADGLLTAIGRRQRAHAVVSVAADVRHRAFTLMMRAYDEVRRALLYLRWHEGDADEFAPSLYAGRGKRRRSRNEPHATSSEVASSAEGPGDHLAAGTLNSVLKQAGLR